MPTCAVNNCLNNTRNSQKKDGVSYFIFPKDPVRRNEWTSIIARNRGEESFKPNTFSHVCSEHFNSSDIYTTNKGFSRLSKKAKPIINLNIEQSELTSQNSIKVQKKRKIIKYETSHVERKDLNTTDDKSSSMVPQTEKIFVKSLTKKQTKNERAKRFRIEPDEILIDDIENAEFYEFGKYVAEQLMCLDIEDAQLAQRQISKILSQLVRNKTKRHLEEPTTSEQGQGDDSNTAPTVTHPAVTQSNLLKPIASSIAEEPQVMTDQNSVETRNQSSTNVNLWTPLKNYPLVENRPSLSNFPVLNVNIEPSRISLGYALPNPDSRPNLTKCNRKGTFLTRLRISSDCTESLSPQFMSADLKTDVKAEPCFNEVNIIAPDKGEELIIKYESSSDDET